MAGRMGGGNVSVRNIRIVKVDSDNNLLVVEGQVPGANQGIVLVKK